MSNTGKAFEIEANKVFAGDFRDFFCFTSSIIIAGIAFAGRISII